MASGISSLMYPPEFSTAVSAHNTSMWYRWLPISKCDNIFTQILPWKSTHDVPLFIPFRIQESKMWDALYTKLVKLLLPFCVVNIQHNEIHLVPGTVILFQIMQRRRSRLESRNHKVKHKVQHHWHHPICFSQNGESATKSAVRLRRTLAKEIQGK